MGVDLEDRTCTVSRRRSINAKEPTNAGTAGVQFPTHPPVSLPIENRYIATVFRVPGSGVAELSSVASSCKKLRAKRKACADSNSARSTRQFLRM